MSNKTLVWDTPTRLYHWLLLIHLVALWYTSSPFNEKIHPIVGQSILALAIFRILWGFMGSHHSRWLNMPFSPRKLFAYLTGKGPHYTGHTPAGAYFSLLVPFIIIVQATTGLMHTDAVFYDGPLRAYTADVITKQVGAIHSLTFDGLLAFIAIHISVVIGYLVIKKDALYKSMITGSKDTTGEPNAAYSLVLALVLAVGCYALVFGGLSMIPQPVMDFGF